MIPRAFHDAPADTGETIELSTTESHYLLRVCRARVGDAVEVFDGQHRLYRGELSAERSRTAVVRLGARKEVPLPPAVELAIACVDPKAAVDVLARALEGGAERLTWIRATHTHFSPPKEERSTRVLRASMRQCGRPTPLHVEGPVALTRWLERPDPRPGWLVSPTERGRAVHAPTIDGGARLLIGPEAGWTPEEHREALDAGLRPLSLGPWILRTEHAVLAAMGLMLGGASSR